jgi:hypothetical protein
MKMKKCSNNLMLTSVIRSLKAYHLHNYPEIHRYLSIKRRHQKLAVSSIFNRWHVHCAPHLLRVRVASCLCALSKRLNTRWALQRWIKHANEGLDIELKADLAYEQWVLRKRREAVQEIASYSLMRRANKERARMVIKYAQKKMLTKGFSMLALGVNA